MLDLKTWWAKAQEETAKQWPWPPYKGKMPPMCERCVDEMLRGEKPVCSCVRKNMTTEGVTNGN